MLNLKKSFLIGFLFIFLIGFVGAYIQGDISVKPIFYLGENMEFSYQLFSYQNQSIQYVPNIICDNSPLGLLKVQNVELIENELFLDRYVFGKVDESIKKGNCRAIISVLSPYKFSFEKNFKVENLLNFNFTLNICKTFSCKEKKKLFFQNESVYLDYSSSVRRLNVKAILIYPDESTMEMNFPKSIKANQIGTYGIMINASKQGYKDVLLKEQFGVVKNKNEINDPFSDEEIETKQFGEYLLFIFLGIVMVLILLLFYLLQSKKRKSF